MKGSIKYKYGVEGTKFFLKKFQKTLDNLELCSYTIGIVNRKADLPFNYKSVFLFGYPLLDPDALLTKGIASGFFYAYELIIA